MLVELLPHVDEEVALPAIAVIAMADTPPIDPFRHARAQFQRSILTRSLFDRVLACGSDLSSYEKVLRDFIWTPTATGR
jgi:hypothetical protein